MNKKKIFISKLAVLASASLLVCFAHSTEHDVEPAPLNTVETIAQAGVGPLSQFTCIHQAIVASPGVSAHLSQAPDADGHPLHVLFAPRDSAFKAAGLTTADAYHCDGDTFAGWPADDVTQMLRAHYSHDEANKLWKLRRQGFVVMVNSDQMDHLGPIEVDRIIFRTFVGDALVVTSNVETTNGVIHVIKHMITDPLNPWSCLLPPEQC